MNSKPREVRVFVVGWNPETGEESQLSAAAYDEFTDENLVAAIGEAMDGAALAIGSHELPRWKPQASVWLWSDRGLRAAMNLPSELIQRMAAAGVSFDFDPYMYDDAGEGQE